MKIQEFGSSAQPTVLILCREDNAEELRQNLPIDTLQAHYHVVLEQLDDTEPTEAEQQANAQVYALYVFDGGGYLAEFAIHQVHARKLFILTAAHEAVNFARKSLLSMVSC